MKLKNPADLTVEESSYILRNAPLIEAWLGAVAGRVDSLLRRGISVPDFKLVMGRAGNREWDYMVDPDHIRDQIMETLGAGLDDVTPRQLISPPEAERMYKQILGRGPKWKEPFAQLTPCITRSPGKLTLASKTDPRPEIRPGETDFLGDNSL